VAEAIEVGAAARSACARIVLASSKNARPASVSSIRRPTRSNGLVSWQASKADSVAGCGLRQVQHSSGLGHMLTLGDCNENPELVERSIRSIFEIIYIISIYWSDLWSGIGFFQSIEQENLKRRSP
jgi:hypothetical protein